MLLGLVGLEVGVVLPRRLVSRRRGPPEVDLGDGRVRTGEGPDDGEPEAVGLPGGDGVDRVVDGGVLVSHGVPHTGNEGSPVGRSTVDPGLPSWRVGKGWWVPSPSPPRFSVQVGLVRKSDPGHVGLVRIETSVIRFFPVPKRVIVHFLFIVEYTSVGLWIFECLVDH